jgi:L-rhamnose mutarotase
MKRVGFLLKVKADRLEEYKQHHKAVWPEMLAALRETGWHNYSLYMREDGLLFGYFETPDSLETAQAGMEKGEVNARWQTMMSSFFEIPEGAHPDQMLVELEEVFHLD